MEQGVEGSESHPSLHSVHDVFFCLCFGAFWAE